MGLNVDCYTLYSLKGGGRDPSRRGSEVFIAVSSLMRQEAKLVATFKNVFSLISWKPSALGSAQLETADSITLNYVRSFHFKYLIWYIRCCKLCASHFLQWVDSPPTAPDTVTLLVVRRDVWRTFCSAARQTRPSTEWKWLKLRVSVLAPLGA